MVTGLVILPEIFDEFEYFFWALGSRYAKKSHQNARNFSGYDWIASSIMPRRHPARALYLNSG
jgi:hypothetical protein